VTRTGEPLRAVQGFVTVIVAAGCLLAAACSDREQVAYGPTPTVANAAGAYQGPGTVQRIVSGTQMHLDGVAIGVGNIWDEQYTTQDGTPKQGRTAAVFIAVEEDASQSRTLRVYPGLEVDAPGYRLHVVSVEDTSVQIAVIQVPH
jgi:hypothetical protein